MKFKPPNHREINSSEYYLTVPHVAARRQTAAFISLAYKVEFWRLETCGIGRLHLFAGIEAEMFSTTGKAQNKVKTWGKIRTAKKPSTHC